MNKICGGVAVENVSAESGKAEVEKNTDGNYKTCV